MIATRRLVWSHAIDRAVDLAETLSKPLLIFEPLEIDYPWAADRHHGAIIDGMAEHRRRLDELGVAYFPYVEPSPGAASGLLESLAARACAVVTDDSPTFFMPGLLDAAARLEGCPVEAVDSCGLLPLAATDQTFSAAYHFRRFLQRTLPEQLGDAPQPDRLAGAALPPLDALPEAITDRWPPAGDDLLGQRGGDRPRPDFGLESLSIDHGVETTGWRGGHAAGGRRLEAFLDDGLDRYADERNDPDSGAASGLSPWLHYGHVSTHEIFQAVADREGWSPIRITAPHDGRRRGWWGMSAGAESFIDELVTWREIGFGYCRHRPDYARYDTLPEWALETLEAHADDERPWLYTAGEFERAETHDEIWNAAQRQLVTDGVIHNYLRMLWGKKILEWSAHPREALEIMVDLNNRYALDGRDPNSWTGIMWILGRFDRGWPERPVFGKVRSMTSDSTRRKVKLSAYLDRWGDQGSLL